MYFIIKSFYGLSNTALAFLTLCVLVLQFSYSAINAGRLAVAEEKMERLGQLSLQELGQLKVRIRRA